MTGKDLPGNEFGAELLSSPLPDMPVGVSDPEKWRAGVLANRKLTLSGFTDLKVNDDAYNDVIAIKLLLEAAKDGDSLSRIHVRLYKDYFADKCKDDPACFDFIMEHSDPVAVDAFDTEVMNMRSLLARPLSPDSIHEIKNGLRKIYIVMYGREPSHF